MRFFIRKIAVILPALLVLSCGVSEDMISKIDEYNTVIVVSVNSSVATDAYYNNDKSIITITSSETDTTVKYTTDGTDPTRTNGTEYTGPLTIQYPAYAAGVLEIRAVAYDSNRMSEVQSVTVSVGDGTAAYPYEIATAAQLKNVSDNVNAGTHTDSFFRQTANINISAYNPWVPIGDITNNFSGSFDGNGFYINGLTISTSADNQGLFGYVTAPSTAVTLENINLVNINVSGGYNTGGLAGYVNGTGAGVTITNCSVSGTSSVSGVESVGGLTGYASVATITDCNAAVTLTSTSKNIGGFAGFIANVTITGCYATGSVQGAALYIGGFAGLSSGTTSVTDSYAKVDVNITGGSADDAGGFIGMIDSTCTISTCFARGDIINSSSSFNRIGGFAGYNAGSITDCYSTGDVQSAGADYGGFAGYTAAGSVITNCYSVGEVTGSGTNDGGFIGAYNAGSFVSSYWLKDAGLPVNPSLNDSANIADLPGVDPGDQTQMKTEATFSGWNFDPAPPWDITPGVTYPYLYQIEFSDFPM